MFRSFILMLLLKCLDFNWWYSKFWCFSPVCHCFPASSSIVPCILSRFCSYTQWKTRYKLWLLHLIYNWNSGNNYFRVPLNRGIRFQVSDCQHVKVLIRSQDFKFAMNPAYLHKYFSSSVKKQNKILRIPREVC